MLGGLLPCLPFHHHHNYVMRAENFRRQYLDGQPNDGSGSSGGGCGGGQRRKRVDETPMSFHLGIGVRIPSHQTKQTKKKRSVSSFDD